jgi:hypothetical protein
MPQMDGFEVQSRLTRRAFAASFLSSGDMSV